jgi:Tol biopolymer transport system component
MTYVAQEVRARWIATAALLAGTLACTCRLSTPDEFTAEPTPSPRSTPAASFAGGGGGQIAFQSSRRDGNFEVYVMDADGNNVVRLTDNPGWDMAPVWSPDGTQIAFMSSRDDPDPRGCLTSGNGCNDEIYVMDADGDNVTCLTCDPAPDGPADWSPDGTRIAFVSERDGNPEIYVMNADGSNVTRLTNDPATDGSPAWSPDGSKIAFGSDRDGNADIYVMDADGSNVTRLTDDLADDEDPAWSPDGVKIAFDSDRYGGFDIYVMDTNGSNVTRLTSDPAWDNHVDWSPDGTRIVFMSSRGDPESEGCLPFCNFEIYVMDADGSNVTRLTDDPAQDWAPAWQP